MKLLKRSTSSFVLAAMVMASPLPSGVPSPSPSPLPFWKAKPEIYKKMQNDRYIAVSAKNEDVLENKKLTVISAGIIHAPESFTHSIVMKFSEYPKYVPYIEETSYDETTHNLFLHGAVLGYHVKMTLHTRLEESNGEHHLHWESIGGSYVGMSGSVDEKEIDPEHTEISMFGLYIGKSLGIPSFILDWGLEFAAHRASGAMRSHIESEWEASKNIDSHLGASNNALMIEIRVAFADTDAMGIVHHANYLRYFEVARVGWLRNKGIDYRDWQKKGQQLPLVESHCRYKKPARFEDLLLVNVNPRQEGLRIVFEYEITNKENGQLLATGQTQHVCVNENLKVMEPTKDILEALL